MAELTQARVRELFNYDGETGLLTWRHRSIHDFPSERIQKSWNTKYAGTVVGTTNQGYRCVVIKGRNYHQHRIIWLYVHGRWPMHWIDHINLNRADNRLANLREATPGENHENRMVRSDSHSRLKGAFFDRSIGRYRSRIKHYGKITELGIFDTAEAAHDAYAKAALKYHGQFARF